MSTPRLIFEKTDSLTEPDLYVEKHQWSDGLTFGVSDGDGVTAAVVMDRNLVLHLHNALSEWLYPQHTPETPNRSLIEQLIEKAVKDQVAAVLPLHLSPQARYVDARGEVWENAAPKDSPAYCRIDGCTLPSMVGAVHFEHDPEPHDVGHPEPTEAWQAELERDKTTAKHRKQHCTCSHSTALHHPVRGCIKWVNVPGEYCTCRWEGIPR